MNVQEIFCIYLVTLWSCVGSFLNGTSPEQACTTMYLEGMMRTNNTDSPSPYKVVMGISDNKYVAGETYRLTISKVHDNVPNFKGFFCQVRKVRGIDAVGDFLVTPSGPHGDKAKSIKCSTTEDTQDFENNAVGYINSDNVSSITLQWRAPKSGFGESVELHALCTVVRSLDVYWEQVQSIERFTEKLVFGVPGPDDTNNTQLPTKKPDTAVAASLHVLVIMLAVLVHVGLNYVMG